MDVISDEALKRLYSPITGKEVTFAEHNFVSDQKCQTCGVTVSRFEASCECGSTNATTSDISMLVSSSSSLSFNPYRHGENGIDGSTSYIYNGGLVNQTSAERMLGASSSTETIKVIEFERPSHVPQAPAIVEMDENGDRKRFARFREKKYVCDACDRTFTLLQNVAHHFYLYHHPRKDSRKIKRPSGNTPIKKFQCTKCSKLFPTHEKAQMHNQREHVAMIALQAKMSHSCPECKKVYSTGSQLEHHILSAHRAEPQFKCPQCPMEFRTLSGQRRHINFTHKMQILKCPFPECTHPGYKCNKALAAHINQHNGERPYKCLHCDKAFFKQTDCRSHEKTHVIHNCSKCFQGFRKRVNRDKHEEKCTSVMVKAEIQAGGDDTLEDGEIRDERSTSPFSAVDADASLVITPIKTPSKYATPVKPKRTPKRTPKKSSVSPIEKAAENSAECQELKSAKEEPENSPLKESQSHENQLDIT